MQPYTDQEPLPWEAYMLRMREKAQAMGLSYEQIAQRSGLMTSTVRRVMELKYCPSLKVFLTLGQVLGFSITENS